MLWFLFVMLHILHSLTLDGTRVVSGCKDLVRSHPSESSPLSDKNREWYLTKLLRLPDAKSESIGHFMALSCTYYLYFFLNLQHPPSCNYHCSPTLSPWRFLPRRPRPIALVKRPGSNGDRSTLLLSPSNTNSAMAFPQAGAHAIPQQL